MSSLNSEHQPRTPSLKDVNFRSMESKSKAYLAVLLISSVKDVRCSLQRVDERLVLFHYTRHGNIWRRDCRWGPRL
jgi:hypothetical protein